MGEKGGRKSWGKRFGKKGQKNRTAIMMACMFRAIACHLKSREPHGQRQTSSLQ
jgi:hypothetical protein